MPSIGVVSSCDVLCGQNPLETGENQSEREARKGRVEALETSLAAAQEELKSRNSQIQNLTRALSQAQAQAADSLSKLAQRIQDLVERDEQIAKLEKDNLAAREEVFELKRRLDAEVRSKGEYESGFKEMAAACERYQRSLENLRAVDISRAEERVRELERRMLAFNRDEVLMRYLEELESLRLQLRNSSAQMIAMRERQKELEAELRSHTANPQKLRATQRQPVKALSAPVGGKVVAGSSAKTSSARPQNNGKESLYPPVPRGEKGVAGGSDKVDRREARPPAVSNVQ